MAACYDQAVRLLARRGHFRRELMAKLVGRGHPETEVAAALDRLGREGYLDDLRTAREFIAQRLRRGPEGRNRLLAELVRRGVEGETAERALADQLPEDDREAARAAAERWRERGGGDPGALARHLARKGFSQRAILAAVREAAGGRDEVPWLDGE